MPTNSDIIQTVFGSQTLQPIRLRANEYSKPLAVGEHWNRIRVGVLLSAPYVGAYDYPAMTFYIGVCTAGRTMKSANPHYVGCCVCGYVGGNTSLTYSAGTGTASYYSSNAFEALSMAGGVNSTAFTGSFTGNIPTSNPANPRRGIMLVDITKSATRVQCFGGAVAHMTYNLGMTDLYSALEQVATTPVVQGISLTAGTAQTGLPALNETTNGYLNAMHLFWNHWAYPLEIYGLAVYHVS